MTEKLEGRCSVCHHVRALYNGALVLHHYSGTIACEGSYKSPLTEPPMIVTDFSDGGDY